MGAEFYSFILKLFAKLLLPYYHILATWSHFHFLFYNQLGICAEISCRSQLHNAQRIIPDIQLPATPLTYLYKFYIFVLCFLSYMPNESVVA